MSDHTPKLIRIKPTSNTIQLVPYWPDNAETWFLYAEADFREQGVSDPHSRFLAVIRSLPRELNRYVTANMFNPEVSDPYALLKAALLKKSDLTDRQRLDELLRNIELGSHSATEVLARMREVIGARTFDDGFFRELFLSKLPQPVQTVLVTLQSVPLDDLAASADKILEISSRPVSNVYSICDKTERQDSEVTKLCNSVKRLLRSRSPRSRSTSQKRTLAHRSKSRGSPKTKPNRVENPEWCWFHNTYGDEARKCRKPCRFKKDPNSGNGHAGTCSRQP
ncbi:unnamed protein product [Heterobilharzia americana]|nr:unnamed protein product [Heterobilharzia americana]